MRKVYVITEEQYGYDAEYDMEDCLKGSETYEVDAEHLEAFKTNYEYEYRYISTIIEAIEKTIADGHYNGTENKPCFTKSGSRKYSFGDTPEWFTALTPPENEPTEKMYFYYEAH